MGGTMTLYTWMCVLAVVCPHVLAFYHESSEMVIQPPPGRKLRNGSYFGYSITYSSPKKRLIISSPRENDIGEVYDCDLEHKNCAPIPRNIPRANENYKHDYWFGATVKAGPDFVVMCAPRNVEKYYTYNAYGTYGICFLYNGYNLTRLKDIDEDVRDSETTKFEETMDSFGWSIDVAVSDTTLVGGPGMFHGRVMMFERPFLSVPKFIKKTDNTPKLNFGYSVASGTFIKKTHLSYAVGSPYGNKGYGQVNFYQGLTFQRTLVKSVDLDVVGSMFGAVLCAATLYGGRTDLLVGAPTYATKSTYNLGAVYVYWANKTGVSPVYTRTILGPSTNSLFGSAIVNLGDLNGDKRDEIAIAAPFENEGRGAVYLYSGADLSSSKSNKDLVWLQRIAPSDKTEYSYSFGLSLTPLLDYDDNGCHELAIGAPYKDRVVVYRCLAAVTVNAVGHFPNLVNRTKLNLTDFELQACLEVDYPQKPVNITALLSTTVEMYHTDAKLKRGVVTFKTSLETRRPSYCEPVPFILPLHGNYETEIRYKISTKLVQDPLQLPFDGSRVQLTDRSRLTWQQSEVAAECAGKLCIPKLNITTHFSFGQNHSYYIIGSSTSERFVIYLENFGEVAYESCVRVYAEGINVLKPSTNCIHETYTDGEDRLLCTPKHPVREREKWSTGDIELDMSRLTNLNKEVTVHISVFNRCKQDAVKHESIAIPVKPDATGIVIKGETDVGDTVEMTEEQIKKDGKQIQQIYTIKNNGLTNWVKLFARITIQRKKYIKYREVPVTVFNSNTYDNCTLSAESDNDYLCPIESLIKKKDEAKIIIPMYIVPGKLNDLTKDKNETISSITTLLLNEKFNVAKSVRSTIRLQDTTVPLKWIILAIVVGLIILVIIAYSLYRCGFLQRQKKEQLRRLQRSVRRQTVLRRSTMPSQGPPEDQINVLEGMEEEHSADTRCEERH